MDKVFEAQEAAEYEAWLESGPGRKYVSASNALLERILDYRPGWRVLDVGCGLGVHLGYLRDRGMLTSGLEAGPVMAKLAGRRLGEKTDISHGDAHDLPYEDNSFDAVIMVNTLELVERRAQALAEAVRVAASRVCVISVNPLSPAYLSRFFLRKGHALHKGATALFVEPVAPGARCPGAGAPDLGRGFPLAQARGRAQAAGVVDRGVRRGDAPLHDAAPGGGGQTPPKAAGAGPHSRPGEPDRKGKVNNR